MTGFSQNFLNYCQPQNCCGLFQELLAASLVNNENDFGRVALLMLISDHTAKSKAPATWSESRSFKNDALPTFWLALLPWCYLTMMGRLPFQDDLEASPCLCKSNQLGHRDLTVAVFIERLSAARCSWHLLLPRGVTAKASRQQSWQYYPCFFCLLPPRLKKQLSAWSNVSLPKHASCP